MAQTETLPQGWTATENTQSRLWAVRDAKGKCRVYHARSLALAAQAARAAHAQDAAALRVFPMPGR